jgi:hypothetical protein
MRSQAFRPALKKCCSSSIWWAIPHSTDDRAIQIPKISEKQPEIQNNFFELTYFFYTQDYKKYKIFGKLKQGA